jgi:hypothetical protein
MSYEIPIFFGRSPSVTSIAIGAAFPLQPVIVSFLAMTGFPLQTKFTELSLK